MCAILFLITQARRADATGKLRMREWGFSRSIQNILRINSRSRKNRVGKCGVLSDPQMAFKETERVLEHHRKETCVWQLVSESLWPRRPMGSYIPTRSFFDHGMEMGVWCKTRQGTVPLSWEHNWLLIGCCYSSLFCCFCTFRLIKTYHNCTARDIMSYRPRNSQWEQQ